MDDDIERQVDRSAEDALTVRVRWELTRMRAAIDDLWGYIDAEGIKALQPSTVQVCKAVHELLHHGSEQ